MICKFRCNALELQKSHQHEIFISSFACIAVARLNRERESSNEHKIINVPGWIIFSEYANEGQSMTQNIHLYPNDVITSTTTTATTTKEALPSSLCVTYCFFLIFHCFDSITLIQFIKWSERLSIAIYTERASVPAHSLHAFIAVKSHKLFHKLP